MAILIDGDMMEVEEQVEEIEDFVVADEEKDTAAQPSAQRDPALVKVVEDHIQKFVTYLPTACHLSGSPVPTDLLPEHLLPFAPYLCFNKELALVPRTLTPDEYIGLLKKSSPITGELFAVSDLKEILPDEIDLMNDSYLSNMPVDLDLRDETGKSEVLKLYRQSTKFSLIPDLTSLSLFMENGENFRDFVGSSNLATKDPLLIQFPAKHSAGSKILASFPKMSPDSLLDYVQFSGKSEIKDMLQEYDSIRSYCDPQMNSYQDIIKRLHDRIKKANPELTI